MPGQLKSKRINKLIQHFFVIGIFVVVFGFWSLVFRPLITKAATPPAIITYQGKLLVNNLAATTTQSIKLVIYDSLTGGNALYTALGTTGVPTAVSVTPTSGIFSVDLGGSGTNTLDPAIFQGTANLYLEVIVGSETLTPRKQITASPFAYSALYLNGVESTSTASSSTYIPVSDSNGNFSFNTVSSTAIRDSVGWLQNQSNVAKLTTGYGNGGFGGGATPSNLIMTSTDFSFFDTAEVNSASKPFKGAVFDGRYVYFVPGGFSSTYNGQVTRYDTTQPFSATSSFSFFNTAAVVASSSAFSGAVFDGRYVYLIPYRRSSNHYFGQITRYDTWQSFSVTSSWSFFNTATLSANSVGFTGAVFDGRYIYLTPSYLDSSGNGQITRYDTTQSFITTSSYSFFNTGGANSNSVNFKGAVFDGRYIYYTVLPQTGVLVITRYDTTQLFVTSSFSYFNLSDIHSGVSDRMAYDNTVFDGRYVYFTQVDSGSFKYYVARYDTADNFLVTSSYKFFNVGALSGASAVGHYGAIFDGRFVYFIPGRSAGGSGTGQITRLDTIGTFSASSSWSIFDISTVNSGAKGYNGGVFDGKYIYLAPHFNGSDAHGLVTRLRAYAGGVDTPNSLAKLARGTDLFIDSQNRIGVGTNGPNGLLTLYNGGLFVGNGNTSSSLEMNQLMVASSTANASGLLLADSLGNLSSSGTFRYFGGVTSTGIGFSSVADGNNIVSTTITFYTTSTNPGNGLIFNTNQTIASSTAALYSWRNNGFKLMSLSSSGTLDVYGAISAMSATVGIPGAPGDFAERVDINPNQEVTPGDLISIDNTNNDTYQKTQDANSIPIGVISTNPTLILGNGKTEHTAVLAMAGRVPVKVNLENGPINIGDPLAPSNQPGVAAKAIKTGIIIGYALEQFNNGNAATQQCNTTTSQQCGSVMTILQRTWWTPGLDVYNSNTNINANQTSYLNNFILDLIQTLSKLGVKIQEGLMSVKSLLITDNLCINETCINENQLKQLLDKNNIIQSQSSPTTGSVALPDNNTLPIDVVSSTVNDTSVTSPSTIIDSAPVVPAEVVAPPVVAPTVSEPAPAAPLSE